MTGPPVGRARFTASGDGTRSTCFRGSHWKLAGQVTVWTPPEYSAPGADRTRFPVLVLLHGYPGTPRTWIDLGDLPAQRADGHNFQTCIGMSPDALAWPSTELTPPGAP